MAKRQTWLLASDQDIARGLMGGCTVYEFEPAADITAYELALLLKMFGDAGLRTKIAAFHDFVLPEIVRRHFRCVQRA